MKKPDSRKAESRLLVSPGYRGSKKFLNRVKVTE